MALTLSVRVTTAPTTHGVYPAILNVKYTGLNSQVVEKQIPIHFNIGSNLKRGDKVPRQLGNPDLPYELTPSALNGLIVDKPSWVMFTLVNRQDTMTNVRVTVGGESGVNIEYTGQEESTALPETVPTNATTYIPIKFTAVGAQIYSLTLYIKYFVSIQQAHVLIVTAQRPVPSRQRSTDGVRQEGSLQSLAYRIYCDGKHRDNALDSLGHG